MKVVFCTPSLAGLTAPYLEALEQSIVPVIAAGWQDGHVQEIGNAYISGARATLLRKALNAMADVVVFIDYDLSWGAGDLLKLIETPGDVVAGTYRFKEDTEHYMGWLDIVDHAVQQRSDGCLKATHVPAGFLKITRNAVNRFMEAYPDLVYGERCNPHIDLFNHGTIDGVWFGEDYAFSKRWCAAAGDIWLAPDLDIAHHSPEVAYPGNFWRHIRENVKPTIRPIPG